jgi:hypothetical protein
MKTKSMFVLITLFLFGAVAISQAQEDEEMKLLFKPKNDKVSNGGYGAFQFGWTKLNGKSTVTIGGSGAWIANHYFALGLAGNGFISDSYLLPNTSAQTYSLYGGYGGILIEPIIASRTMVHVSFPIIFGAGGIVASSFDTYYPAGGYYYNYYDDVDPFFIFQPGVEVEINIVKFFRLAVGVSYILTDGIDLQYKYFDDSDQGKVLTIDKKALDGFVATITFKFGKF